MNPEYEPLTCDQLRALKKRVGKAKWAGIDEAIAEKALAMLDAAVPAVYIAPVVPCPKPRMTRSDKWKERPAVMRYRTFADALREWAGEAGFAPPEAGLSMTFLLPMPSSWPKKKRAAMEGQPHQQKPDKDNLEKAVWDAFFGDDSRVWHTRSVEKRWARNGAIIFTVEPIAQERAA